MRKRTVLAIAVLVVLVAAGCGEESDGTASTTTGAGSAPTAADLDGKVFVTAEVLESGTPRPMAKGTELTLTFEDGRVSANAGCNTMGGGYSLKDGALVVGAMSSTMMGCPDDLATQDTFVSDFLSSSPTVELDGATLTLTNGQDQLVLTEKGAGGGAFQPLTGDWVLDTIIEGNTASAVPAGVEAGLVLDEVGTYTLATGCNTGGGSFTFDGTDLTFDPPRLTKMACKDEAASSVEAVMLAVLDGTVATSRSPGVLTLEQGTQGLGFTAK